MSDIIVLVSGRLREGKDTFAGLLQQALAARNISSRIMRFADPIKETAAKLLGVSREELEAPGRKEHWRQFLIDLGDLVRDWREDAFAQTALERARDAQEVVTIIPDLRYPNEATLALDDASVDVRLVRVRRLWNEDEAVPEVEHKTETSIRDDSFPWWRVCLAPSGRIDVIEREACQAAAEIEALLPAFRGKVYLAGAIEHAADPAGWRRRAADRLAEYGIDSFDPLDRVGCCLSPAELAVLSDFRHPQDHAKLSAMRKVQAFDRSRLEQSDIVLVLWDEAAARGGGTHAEIELAVRLGKPVLAVTLVTMPTWTRASCTMVFSTLEDALECVRRTLGPVPEEALA